MKFLADEDVDQPIVKRLRQEGWDVLYVAEFASGSSDEEVLTNANAQQAILITEDKDFGELVFRLRRLTEGVVLLRLAGLPTETKADIVALVFREHAPAFREAFSVISPGHVRIRPR